MPKTQSPDNTGGVEDREEDRKEAELDDQQTLNQGSDTGTHSSTRNGVNWGRSYRGKLVPDKKIGERASGNNGSSQNNPTKDEITHRAYALYLMRGGEHGRDIEDWVQATRELIEPKETTAAKEAVATRADLRSAWPE